MPSRNSSRLLFFAGIGGCAVVFFLAILGGGYRRNHSISASLRKRNDDQNYPTHSILILRGGERQSLSEKINLNRVLMRTPQDGSERTGPKI
mmetsp:Transcript_30994/g.54388  ORF Transcript_30994/g.54388 Transcript_30994/m.54388 type:complete len:92 (+) Transcript_30994:2-277(+)